MDFSIASDILTAPRYYFQLIIVSRAQKKLQNRMIRTILRSRLDTPIRSMLETLKFLSVRQRVTYNTMVLLYKMEENLLPDYLCSTLYRVSSSNSHNTRSGDDFVLPNFRKATTPNSLIYNSMKIYNDMRRPVFLKEAI
jgi:hypothetical protein